MISLTDLKVGDYVGWIWGNDVEIVKKINKKSFTTTTGSTIYESEFKHYFVITEEEARASIIHDYNEDLKELNKHLKELLDNLELIYGVNPYYTIDTQAIEEKINDLIESIREELENEWFWKQIKRDSRNW